MFGYFNKKSFTLVETIVAIFIFTLALGAVTGFVVMAYRTHGYTWQQSIAIDEARRGVETMVREIREARAGDDGSYPIEKARDKEFVFYSDIDGDGATERVRYFLGTVVSGTGQNELKKGVINPTGFPIQYPSEQEQVTILSSYVRNIPPIFRYFDAKGRELTALPARLKDTKVIEVYLVINVDPNRPPQDFELRSSVQLRNLKTE